MPGALPEGFVICRETFRENRGIMHYLFILLGFFFMTTGAPEACGGAETQAGMRGSTTPDATETNPREHYPYAVSDGTEQDFGKVHAGTRINGTISITNEGSEDLLVARVRSSCGLMIPTWPDMPTPPGETLLITYRYDSDRIGPFERLITIHTNAWQKDLVVRVRGEIIPPPE